MPTRSNTPALAVPALAAGRASSLFPYSNPFSKACRFSSRKLGGTESVTALRTASAVKSFVTAVKNPTITEFNTMRLPSSSAMRVAGMLQTLSGSPFKIGDAHQIFFNDQNALRFEFRCEAVVGLLRQDDHLRCRAASRKGYSTGESESTSCALHAPPRALPDRSSGSWWRSHFRKLMPPCPGGWPRELLPGRQSLQRESFR